jgi:hypothetical protein
MNIRKLLKQLRTHLEVNSLDLSGFRAAPKFILNLKNESTKDMRIIARSIKFVHEKGNHEEDLNILCSKFNLTFLSKINENRYVFIKKDSLTKYESENSVITISAYKGDSWFKDIDSKFSKENVPSTKDLIRFYTSLEDEKKSEIDPIKLRTLDYSIYMLQQRYLIDYFETEYYQIFTVNHSALIINKASKEEIEIEIKPIRGILNRIFKVYQKLGLVFYATAIAVIAAYSLQSIQIDVIPPFIQFAPYSHEIGQVFDKSNPISSIDDNMESAFFIDYEVTNSPILSEPGDVILEYIVKDRSNNFREQSTSIRVVDTTPPVLANSNLNNVIEYDDFRRFDYLRLINASDNHRLDSLTYQLPFDVSPEAKPLGNYVVSFNAQDPSGNRTSLNRSITIVDTVPPSFNLSSPTITVNFNVARTYNYTQHAVNVNDNYDASRVRIESSTTYDYANPGSYPFTITAIDPSGNRTSRTLTVNVVDTTPPVVRVVSEITLNIMNVGSFDPSTLILETRDNHRVASITQSSITTLNNRIGTVNFETIVTDPSGNRTVGVTRITLVDTTPPRIQVVRSSSSYLNRIPTPQEIISMVTVTDNFDPNPVITWSGVFNSSRFTNGFNNVITITATDNSKNRSTVTVNINIRDTVAPVLTFKDSGLTLTVSQAQTSPYQYSTIRQVNRFMDFVASVTDNVSDSSQITVTLVETGTYNITQVGVVTLRYRVSDFAGNVAEFNYQIRTIANPPSGGS